MAEEQGGFTPIETQEAFDAAVAEALSAREAEVRGEYADYAELKKSAGKLAESQNIIDKLKAENKAHIAKALKTSIALETGLPYSLAGRLAGETEKEIRADAEALKKLMAPRTAPPLAEPEKPVTATARGALKGLRDGLLEE